MLLLAWQTKKGRIPRFRHHGFYDSAPSHWKKSPGALNVDSIAKGDGHGKGKPRVEKTAWQGVSQSMVLLNSETGAPVLDADGNLRRSVPSGAIGTRTAWCRGERRRSPSMRCVIS